MENGRVLRKEPTDDCAIVVGWTPEGKKKRVQRQRGGEWWWLNGAEQAGILGTPSSLRPATMEERSPRLVCLAQRKTRKYV